jgi:diguanylate cyclase (GGDEF)-like protein
VKAIELDEPGRAKFVRLAGLSRADLDLAATLQREIIAPRAETIVDAFYGHLRHEPDFVAILNANDARIENLRTTYLRYLLSFGLDFESGDYFRERMRIGAIHAAVGVPLSLYVAAGRLLQQLLVDGVVAGFPDAADARPLTELVLKLTALDTSLVVEAYHGTRVESLESSVETLRARGEALARDLSTDALTGVASRRSVLEILEHALENARDDGRCTGIILLDLDHFKRINDRHGHGAGDEVLRVTAARIRASLRPLDTIGRYGGEEFLIVLPDADLATCRLVAERGRRVLNADAVNVDGVAVPVSASQGIAVSDGTMAASRLVECADAALYAAKRAGRDRVATPEDVDHPASAAALRPPGR